MARPLARTVRRLATLAILSAAAAFAPARAVAAEPAPSEDLPRARWHPTYAAEIEAHGTIAAFDEFFVGLGGGARFTVPVWSHAPFKGIDDTIAFGIGFDAVRYGAYKPLDPREPTIGVVAYYVPVYMQWNVWLGARASLFVEPTLMWRFADYVDNCGPLPCARTTRFMPTGSLGMRFRIIDRLALTFRAGWPMASIGLSWL